MGNTNCFWRLHIAKQREHTDSRWRLRWERVSARRRSRLDTLSTAADCSCWNRWGRSGLGRRQRTRRLPLDCLCGSNWVRRRADAQSPSSADSSVVQRCQIHSEGSPRRHQLDTLARHTNQPTNSRVALMLSWVACSAMDIHPRY